ncbi:hypothetical protein EDB81DRAFT_281046 [Dactylonectria macrodidyma]|uniref:Uncharacterized protein n=1 Tax=Dactylonectria macrodidyma TaxID=307937 RepID=A0A9P9FM76_9HYPO|nr:hypothetical protein EDB81DRAFT_281046 [Dactylonectria macrodidyma]
MLAAHRDQENVVHSHQVPSKQQLKTPGARYPKTPSRFARNDENAPTAFAGKTGLGGAKQFGGNDKSAMKANGTRHALVTPMDTRGRAPLGNKTTNAKAKSGQAGGVKGIVKELEKTQLKPTVHKPKQLSVDLAPLEYKVRNEQKAIEEEEPEYAPPRPKDLPYESDVFPQDLLTFEGLKSENLLKGYYQHFYNPVDDEGVSRQDREFEKTMKNVMAKAEERNQRDMDALDWNIADVPDTARRQPKTNDLHKRSNSISNQRTKTLMSKQPNSVSSRRAASALSMASDSSKSTGAPMTIRTTKTRKPLSSILQTKKPAAVGKASLADSAAGEAASRTTIGYNRGRSASSMLYTQPRIPSESSRPPRTVKPAASVGCLSDMTITPARLRQAGMKKQESQPRPQFMSIFDEEDGEDEDLLPVSRQPQLSDDEDEFELKLDF